MTDIILLAALTGIVMALGYYAVIRTFAAANPAIEDIKSENDTDVKLSDTIEAIAQVQRPRRQRKPRKPRNPNNTNTVATPTNKPAAPKSAAKPDAKPARRRRAPAKKTV